MFRAKKSNFTEKLCKRKTFTRHWLRYVTFIGIIMAIFCAGGVRVIIIASHFSCTSTYSKAALAVEGETEYFYFMTRPPECWSGYGIDAGRIIAGPGQLKTF